jgi:hypothetical protein
MAGSLHKVRSLRQSVQSTGLRKAQTTAKPEPLDAQMAQVHLGPGEETDPLEAGMPRRLHAAPGDKCTHHHVVVCWSPIFHLSRILCLRIDIAGH